MAIRGRAYKVNPLTGRHEIVTYHFDVATADLLTRVVAIYGRLSAAVLRELAHTPGGPWDKVWNHGGKINPGMRIDDRDIERFYSRIPFAPPVTERAALANRASCPARGAGLRLSTLY
jgi:hypothetical protein